MFDEKGSNPYLHISPLYHYINYICIISPLISSSSQPFCRLPKTKPRPEARSLFAGAGAAGARFAAELLTELAQRQRTVDEALSLEETINAMRRAAKQGMDGDGEMVVVSMAMGVPPNGWMVYR